jgi:hypothetical protein
LLPAHREQGASVAGFKAQVKNDKRIAKMEIHP